MLEAVYCYYCILAMLTPDFVQSAGQGFGRGSKKGPGRHSAGGGRGGHSQRVAPYQAPHVSHQPPTAHKFQVGNLAPFGNPTLRCVTSAPMHYIARRVLAEVCCNCDKRIERFSTS